MPRKHIFTAGPSVFPMPVLEKLSASLLDYEGRGQSVLELSHRSSDYAEIHSKAKQGIMDLLGLGDDWHVLFLQGGASTQFATIPMNYLAEGETAAYAVTGAWAQKAAAEAKLFGKVDIVGSSEDSGFDRIPASLSSCEGSKYLHYTSNNTIFGTQWSKAPSEGAPLVCDASSDILSRPMELDRHVAIYAGAQKNLGPAGATLVLLKKDFAESKARELPTMFDYQTHIKKDSAFNTPPVFSIYGISLMLEWIREQGGLEAIAERNHHKAGALYDTIDDVELYLGHAKPGSRSLMNVTFTLRDAALSDAFLEGATEAGMIGLKGHRSVGGFRASIYNALPQSSVDALCAYMTDFASRH